MEVTILNGDQVAKAHTDARNAWIKAVNDATLSNGMRQWALSAETLDAWWPKADPR